MQKWHLNGMDCWLCDACSRQNAPLVLSQGWTWIREEVGPEMVCDSCRCTDRVVQRYGRFRWLFCWLIMLLPWAATNRRRQALRRAK